MTEKFINYLCPKALELEDDNGNSFFPYAVGASDEDIIFVLMNHGADLMKLSKDVTESLKENGDVKRSEYSDANKFGDKTRPKKLPKKKASLQIISS